MSNRVPPHGDDPPDPASVSDWTKSGGFYTSLGGKPLFGRSLPED